MKHLLPLILLFSILACDKDDIEAPRQDGYIKAIVAGELKNCTYTLSSGRYDADYQVTFTSDDSMPYDAFQLDIKNVNALLDKPLPFTFASSNPWAQVYSYFNDVDELYGYVCNTEEDSLHFSVTSIADRRIKGVFSGEFRSGLSIRSVTGGEFDLPFSP